MPFFLKGENKNTAAAWDNVLFIPVWDMRDVLPVFLLFFLQRHPAGLPGRAAEELRGHAGADAWREGFSGDWLPAGEGKRISTGV